MLKVFLVDDHEVVRRGVGNLLDEEDDLTVVGQAGSVTEALARIPALRPDVAVLDMRLPDGNGVELGVEFLQSVPQMLVIVMTGTILPPEEEALCEEHDFPVLRKPFLASDVMNQIRSRLLPVTGVVRA